MLSRRKFFNKAAMFVAGCALALKCELSSAILEAEVPELTIVDLDKFQRLPFYLVKNEVKHIHDYRAWEQLMGQSKWNPNMGSVIRSVR